MYKEYRKTEKYKLYKKEYDKQYHSKKYLKQNKISKEKYGVSARTIKRYGFKLVLYVYDKFDRKCVKCGEINNLHIHHLDRRGTNLSDIEMNNDKENLILLCMRCHGSLHSKQRWAGHIKKTDEEIRLERKEYNNRNKDKLKELHMKYYQKIKLNPEFVKSNREKANRYYWSHKV